LTAAEGSRVAVVRHQQHRRGDVRRRVRLDRSRDGPKHAGRRATGGSGINGLTRIPMADRDAIRAFFAGGDRARWHRESRVRVDRARTSPGVRPPAVLVAGRWDARRARSETPLTREVPTRNGACPCGSGRRFRECHGGFGAGGRA
jgi:hypothetical protein